MEFNKIAGEMRERICKNCGGKRYKEVGQNIFKCLFCGTIYVDEYLTKEEEILIVRAYEKLREYKFENAESDFKKILSLYPKSYEAYFGLLQAKHKVVYFTSKNGVKRYPTFFGQKIPSFLADEDFKKAVEYAPKEVAKSYEEQAKFVENVRKEFLENNLAKIDVIFNGNSKSKNFEKIREALSAYPTFQREEAKKKGGNLEVQLFNAVNSAKCLVLLLEDEKDLTDAKMKNLTDRFIYRINAKQRFPSSFIVAYDGAKVGLESLKLAFPFLETLLSTSDIAFVLNLQSSVEKAVAREYNEEVTLPTREVEEVAPVKVEPKPVTARELGHYNVENIPLSDKNKTKWIFYSLKNGDFETAKRLVSEEIDDNRGEIYFASLLCEEGLRTPEEFFSKLENFKNKDLIEKILKYSESDFANDFVNKWEQLIVREDDADEYAKFLPFLLPYMNSWRGEFIESAKSKAIETGNDALISAVEGALSSNDELIGFYFQLAQKSGDESYYQKILSLNSGHVPSLYAKFLQNFSTPKDKLSFRDDEAVKSVLQYCTDEQKGNFLNNIISLVLEVAFFDLESAEKQIDYYLSYLTSPQDALVRVARFLKEQSFFRLAEKYITLAIKNDKENASLYWELIQIKSHSKSEAELLTTNVKIAELDDWSSVLTYSSEADAEHYAQIVANANINSATKVFREENLDKIRLKEKIRSFITRNDKILNEVEDKTTATYFREQIHAFEIYLDKIDKAENFESYSDILGKIADRLNALELSLDSSVSLAQIATKAERYSRVSKDIEGQKEKGGKESVAQKARRNIAIFSCLCIVPMALVSLLLIFVVAMPSEMYLWISQDAVIVLTLLSVLLGVGVFIYNLLKKSSTPFYKVARISLFALSIVNLILMMFGLYLSPPSLYAGSATEFLSYLHNAKYANISLTEDIDMANVAWSPSAFYGRIDGGGHTVKKLSAEMIFTNLSGNVENLTVVFSDYDGEEFYGIAKTLNGEIKNCHVVANVYLQGEGTFGGMVGELADGEISNSTATIEIDIRGKVTFGALVGRMNEEASVHQTSTSLSGTIVGEGNIGGLVGENYGGAISESYSALSLSATIDNANFGGLVGLNRGNIENCYALGTLSIGGGVNDVGGLVGEFFRRGRVIDKSYSAVVVTHDVGYFGAIVGNFEEGAVTNSFAFHGKEIYHEKGADIVAPEPTNCQIFEESYEFSNSFSLDGEIWSAPDGEMPTLLWQNESGTN